jgi:proline iminopeptidase
MTLAPRPNYDPGHGESTLALARIETHYFVNDSFIREGEILANAHLLRGLPGFIVQGRYDVVTPATTSHELHALWPDSRIDIVPDAGHATNEPGTAAKLVEATDFFR